MTEKVLGTGEKPAWHFTPDVTAGFTPEPSPFEQNESGRTECAGKNFVERRWLWSAKPLKLTLCITLQKTIKKIAIAVASMWKKNLGVDVKLQNQEWKTYIDSRNTGNFDVIRASWVGIIMNPPTFPDIINVNAFREYFTL